MERTRVFLYAAALSLTAAAMHAWAMPEHLEEWWGYGSFFLIAATAQVCYGLALLRRPGRMLLLLGVVGNLAIVSLWAVTRTVGIPFVGPHAGEAEPVAALDLLATMAELALVTVLLAALLRSARRTEVVNPVAEVASATADEPGQVLSRRDFLRASGAVGAVGISGGVLGAYAADARGQDEGVGSGGHGGDVGSAPTHMGNTLVGDVDLSRFDPTEFLRDFYWGEEQRENGQVVREYELTAEETEVEVAPGVMYPAWAYNGQVPGPTLRATEGDRLRVVFKNQGVHPHTIHFHGFHPANMDGVFEQVGPGQEFVYEFDAEPFGTHLYHCHTMPLKKHIEKGLYGAFIVDPKEGRPEADELVRIYVVNVLEFDFINSFHTHANFFDYYPTGTRLEPSEFTDTRVFGQGERGIMEFRYHFPGRFMFHAHVSEFAELGWMGIFEVEE